MRMCLYVCLCAWVWSDLLSHSPSFVRTKVFLWTLGSPGILTGHLSVAIHRLYVLTIVVCAPPCLSFYLRTSNPNSGAHTCTVSTLPTISLPSTTKTMKQTLLLLGSAEGDTLHQSTAVEFFVASTTYLSQTLMRGYSSLTHCWRACRTKCKSSYDPNQVVTIWWPADYELWFHVIQTLDCLPGTSATW